MTALHRTHAAAEAAAVAEFNLNDEQRRLVVQSGARRLSRQAARSTIARVRKVGNQVMRPTDLS